MASLKEKINTNSLQTLPKIKRGRSTSQLILWDQYYTDVKTRHHKKRKLQITSFINIDAEIFK